MTNPDPGAVEREKIVAWLRDPERRKFMPMPDHVVPAHMAVDDYGDEIGWMPERREKRSRLPTPKDFADAISRGDHLRTGRD